VGYYSVFVYGGRRSLPTRHLVAAGDLPSASAIADDLLARSAKGVGVEVVRNGEPLYARGVVPARAFRQPMTDLQGDEIRGDLAPAPPRLQA
jgi:hypothetical protein